jgi:hypothetical protein
MPSLSGRIDPQHGPTVFVKVMQSPEYVDALKKAGRSYATPTSVMGILDTGASGSALDAQIITRMSLLHRGYTGIHTPSTGPGVEYRAVYDASLVLGEDESSPLTCTVEVVECEFASHGFFVLIGRDILSRCILTYDGPADRFTLTW